MKKLTLVLLLSSSLLASCIDRRVYTLSTLDKIFHTDIDLDGEYWECVVPRSGGRLESITDSPHNIGDTIEIVHTDMTTSKYILTAIK